MTGENMPKFSRTAFFRTDAIGSFLLFSMEDRLKYIYRILFYLKRIYSRWIHTYKSFQCKFMGTRIRKLFEAFFSIVIVKNDR